MSYVVPQTLVFQEFEAAPAVVSTTQAACIIGPRRDLIRYSKSEEKERGRLGSYDYVAGLTRVWPHRGPGDVVIPESVRVFIDNALLKYFSKTSVAHATGKSATLQQKIFGAATGSNVIRAENVVWRGEGRHDDLACDVEIGDAVRVSAVVDGEVLTADSVVVGMLADRVAATIGEAEGADGNAPEQSSQATITRKQGTPEATPSVTVAVVSSDHVCKTGVHTDKYTLVCLEGGDYDKAVFSLVSESGTDVVPEFRFAASSFGAQAVIGVHEAIGLSFDDEHTGSPYFVTGTTWEIQVTFDVDTTNLLLGGVYTGDVDTTYVVEVVRGGVLNSEDPPYVMVTTTTGYDSSGPTAGVGEITIGTRGIVTSIDDTDRLVVGDRWYIEVKAAKPGAVKTLVLQDALPADMVTETPVALDVSLYLKKNFEVPALRDGQLGVKNFDVEDTQVVVNPGITWRDSRVLESGNLKPLPVVGGDVFVEFAATVTEGALVVNGITDVGALGTAATVGTHLGVVDPANPLAYGVYKALSNTDHGRVMYIQTAGDSLDDYLNALDVLSNRNDVYFLVPMTFNREIQDAVAAHVENMSRPETGRWRRAMVCRPAVAEVAVVSEATSENNQIVLATITDDPAASGTQYTRLTITSGNANLFTSQVQARDVVRIGFRADGMFASEYVVDAVVSPTEIRLLSGPGNQITVPTKIEIWHRRTKGELAVSVARDAATFGTRRVSNVWPDYPEVAGTPVPGYYLAAATAGLKSSVMPHQSLTRVALSGFDGMSRTTQLFNTAQLNTMAESGVLIVTQSPTGQIYVRHDLTTDTSDINTAEHMRTTNLDSISYVLLARLSGLRGGRNITPQLEELVRLSVTEAIEALQRSTDTKSLGPQILGIVGEVTCKQHPLFKDRLLIAVSPELPYPCNNEELHIVVA